jgi:hypothetical protein
MEAEWVVAPEEISGRKVKIIDYPGGLRCANPIYETG